MTTKAQIQGSQAQITDLPVARKGELWDFGTMYC